MRKQFVRKKFKVTLSRHRSTPSHRLDRPTRPASNCPVSIVANENVIGIRFPAFRRERKITAPNPTVAKRRAWRYLGARKHRSSDHSQNPQQLKLEMQRHGLL